MKTPALRASAALVLVAFLALRGAVSAQITSPTIAQQSDDKTAFNHYASVIETLTGRGNFAPGFSTVTLFKTDKAGHRAAGSQTIVKTDDRYTFVRTQLNSALLGPGQSYNLYFDGFSEFFDKGDVGWKRSGDFPRQPGSQVIITDGSGPSKATTLYVSEVTDTYPGFDWLQGPFVIIRQRPDNSVYAVWSGALNWPVLTQDLEVEGAVSDGKHLGQTDTDVLDRVASAKGFPAEQAKLAERRAAFEGRLQFKPVFKGAPVDLLPQYRDQAINDPEAQIAGSLAGYIPSAVTDKTGVTTVAGIELRAATPAWWTVSRGHQKIYILGVPWLFREDVAWNKTRLTNRLHDALRGGVILPPLFADDDQRQAELPPGDPESIPDVYRERVRKAAADMGKPAQRYLGLSPLLAGYRLSTDFRDKAGLKPELVTAEIAGVARTMTLSSNVAGTLLWPGESSVPGPTAGLNCLDAALDEVESGKPAFDQAMEAWAAGDVRTALTAPRGLERCSFAFPAQSQIREEAIRLQVDAIKARLEPTSRPSVAVVYLRALLSSDGVLARLQAQGYKIAAPKS